MAALTRDRNTPEREGKILVLPMAAATTIYAGSLVVINADGFAAPGSTAANVKAAGRAEEYRVNSGNAGEETIKVRRGVFKFANTEVDPVTALLSTCYIVDDQTVAGTNDAGQRSAAGKVLAIEPDGVWVEVL
ncbi:hypothetical protein [Propionispora vibrioides]|uniref:Uncharacterized protein n=1 Tax=Propionispora vibrioides TaxID=112903 RepID=A0A1H8U595_9FIRM|nr:hypothetical protein [Propionispora vibrioides]SEO98325.1 hypothetical protein SAMN04490178_10835 [Propionispora vibrioides]